MCAYVDDYTFVKDIVLEPPSAHHESSQSVSRHMSPLSGTLTTGLKEQVIIGASSRHPSSSDCALKRTSADEELLPHAPQTSDCH